MKISEYIERDLAERIELGKGLPARLTIAEIAKLYEVSPTPVRAALEGLLERQLLVKQPNGRLQLGELGSRPRKPGNGVPARPGLTPADLEARIGRDVILHSLVQEEPAFLREESMAEEHGIGRAQVRSVFQRLAGGGILEHIPRRGWRVPKFDQRRMDSYVEIREALELKALDLAKARLDPARLDQMIEGNSAEAAAAGSIDNTLHAYFIELSRNRYIQGFFDTNGRYYTALFDYAGLGADVMQAMAEQHREILEQARSRRWAKARRALGDHVQAQRPVMAAMIEIIRGR